MKNLISRVTTWLKKRLQYENYQKIAAVAVFLALVVFPTVSIIKQLASYAAPDVQTLYKPTSAPNPGALLPGKHYIVSTLIQDPYRDTEQIVQYVNGLIGKPYPPNPAYCVVNLLTYSLDKWAGIGVWRVDTLVEVQPITSDHCSITSAK